MAIAFVICHEKEVIVMLTFNVGDSIQLLGSVFNSSTVDVVATRTTLKRRRPVNSAVLVSL